MSKKKPIDISVVSSYVNGEIPLAKAAYLLNVSTRTVLRYAVRYRADGQDGLVHRNTGKHPHNRLDEGIRIKILEIIEKNASIRSMPYVLAIDYLQRYHGIQVSKETLRRIIVADSEARSKRKISQHPLRRRRSQFGELIQIDGSPHYWLGTDHPQICLMLFVDDATSAITAARFAEAENAHTYRLLIEEHILRFGLPVAFYSDRHSSFITTHIVPSEYVKHESQTQYQRICETLGIYTIFANSPQAKGRIERLNRTLQGRWPYELQFHRVDSIEKANERLPSMIKAYNEEFAVSARDNDDAHVPCPCSTQDLHRICGYWTEKALDKNLMFSKNNVRYQVRKYQTGANRGQTVFLVQLLDGTEEIISVEHNFEGQMKFRSLRFESYPVERKAPKKEMSFIENTKTVDYRIDMLLKQGRDNLEKEKRENQLKETAPTNPLK